MRLGIVIGVMGSGMTMMIDGRDRNENGYIDKENIEIKRRKINQCGRVGIWLSNNRDLGKISKQPEIL